MPLHLFAELERRVLSHLCMRTKGPERKKLLTALASYAWQDSEHRIIFEALRELRNANSEAMRELLPAYLTRKGFPDINWNRYLGATAFRTDEVLKWVGKLKTLSAEARRRGHPAFYRQAE